MRNPSKSPWKTHQNQVKIDETPWKKGVKRPETEAKQVDPSGHGGAEGPKDHHGPGGVGGAPEWLRLRHLQHHGVDKEHDEDLIKAFKGAI